jgi:Tfp pilus assembly PilM family ATPase
LSRFLSIDADAHGLFVAAATLRGGGAITLEHVLTLGDETAPLSPANATDLGARLKELLRQAGVRPAPVLLCIGRDRVIPKAVRHPPTAPAEEPAVVRFQALRELTENPDDVLMDYIPVGEPTAGERQALAVFVRKQVVQAARDLCETAGLRLAAVTPRPFAALAAARYAFATGAAPAPDAPSAAIAVVTLWDRGGEFTVSRGPDLTFSRPIPAHAAASEQSLVAELKRNLAVYAGQNPAAPVEAVYLAEPDEPGAGWAGRVRAALSVPVYAFDPLAGSPMAVTTPAPLHGRFAGPVGLLAARSASATLPINFAQARQPRAEPGKARTRVLLGALAGVVVFALVAVLAFLEIDKSARKVRTLTAERDGLDAQLKDLDLGAKRLAAADEFAAREVNPLDELYDLADRNPDVAKVTVTEFDLNALPPPKKDNRPTSSQTQPVSPKAPAAPVAALKVSLRAGDPTQAQRLVDGFKNDKYYVGVYPTIGGQGGAETKGQPFTIAPQVLHRAPNEYTRHLHVQPPPAEDRRGDPDAEFDQ